MTSSVRVGPQIYHCDSGAWNRVPDYLQSQNINTVLLLHGGKSWEAAAPFFPDLIQTTMYKVRYRGVCTLSEIKRIELLTKQNAVCALIVVGGGTISDLGKQVAHNCHLPIIILPTLAATCAAWTPLSVIYDEHGAMLRYNIFDRATAAVFIDPQVVLTSPKPLFIAGIIDTLAKWYEADVGLRQLQDKTLDLELAHQYAKQCQDILLLDSIEALDDMTHKRVTPTFRRVMETNIMLAGLVGGFGDEAARTTGAHALHDAMTILPDSHKILHGIKVGYGIFIQLRLEQRLDEINRLLPWFKQLGVPITLKAMLKRSLSDTEIRAIATKACAEDSQIFLVDASITPKQVFSAMIEQETM